MSIAPNLSTHADPVIAGGKPLVEMGAGTNDVGLPAAFRPVFLTATSRSTAARERLSALRAVVLLDGTVRRSPFVEAIDRSILELPLKPDLSLLDMWREQIAELCEAARLPELLPCRVVLGRTTRSPALRPPDQSAGFSVETDPAELRGTGGVLRDLAERYDDDDVLLVANAAQVLLEPLRAIASESAERGGDVTVLANEDGTPSSLTLVTCRALRDLPEIGFIDLKEQGLPLMARRHDIRVVTRAKAGALPIRTPHDYLAALSAYHFAAADGFAQSGPFAERWRRRFSLIEAGAVVAGDADLHNAVVLRTGALEAGAFAAESIVCGSCVVRRHERVLRQVVTSTGRLTIESQSK